MKKNVLIVSTSPRKDGNSDTLAEEFAQGAQKMSTADVLVFATPIYYYKMSG